MAMTRFEKRFVNREKKAQRNVKKVEQYLQKLDVEKIHQVLELGCGIGAVSAYLSNEYEMEVYGTDFDPDQIEIARSIYPQNEKLQFGIEDASNLSCDDNNFDLVISQNVFHHIPNWRNAIREVQRVLKKDGTFIWDDLSFPKIVIEIFQPFVKNYGLYTFSDIEEELFEVEFEQIACKHFWHGFFPHHHLVVKKKTRLKT